LFPEYFTEELARKSKDAIAFLKQESPPVCESPYWVGFSGGKDSIVLKDIVARSNVRAELHYSVTTIDPPELMRYIKEYHKEVTWDRPKKSFVVAMSERGLPMRPHGRWCCQEYKESGPASTSKCRIVVTGIRKAESSSRKNRSAKEQCYRVKSKTMIHPLLEWTDDDIWHYIKIHNLPYCSLYDEGFKRLGCIGCPFASQKNRDREFKRWPKYRELYKKSIIKLYEKNKTKPWAKSFESGASLAEAWITKINPFPPKVLIELFEEYVK
jgi:phosphoadenosine phosphosulfate reductase